MYFISLRVILWGNGPLQIVNIEAQWSSSAWQKMFDCIGISKISL